MAFDPAKPVEDAPLDAAEMRNQLNALHDEIAALRQELIPVLTFDSAGGLWNVTYAGPPPVAWAFWKRCNSAPDWQKAIQLGPSQFPMPANWVLVGDEVWWQIKLVGLDGDDQPMTPFSNVISSPNVPE
jgi:hypothetical protein